MHVFLVHLFINKVFDSGQIPNEWKYGIFTLLCKGKGPSTNFDNYRGISVLTPIGKIFESSKQITNYFAYDNFLTKYQHGFRSTSF